MKGLVGDTSDNIPGVKGCWGERGRESNSEIWHFGRDLRSFGLRSAKGTRAKLETDRENAFLSRDLGRIITDVPGVELNIEAGRTQDFDLVEVANLLCRVGV